VAIDGDDGTELWLETALTKKLNGDVAYSFSSTAASGRKGDADM